MNLAPTRYVVRTGDNLSRIAQQRGYADWKIVYNAACNQDLRRKRPDPNRIMPGDIVMLPPTASDIRATLQERLRSLQQLRVDTDQMFVGLDREVDTAFEKYEKNATGIDWTADILTGLATLTLKGAKAIKLSGAALEKANDELGKHAVVNFVYKPIAKAVVLSVKDKFKATEQVGSGAAWALGKAFDFVLDMTKPSYWAYAVSELRESGSVKNALTRRPKDVQKDTKAQLTATRRQTLEQLDAKIRETQTLLNKVGGSIRDPLPL